MAVVVDEKSCARLTAHRPRDDVAYRPGVDHKGKPVAPADLNSHTIDLPPSYRFELEFRPFDKRLDGRSLRQRLGLTTLHLGEVVVGRDGRVSFAGQDLYDEETALITDLCRQLFNRPVAAPR